MSTTRSLALLHHSVRTHAPMDYEIIAYFEADQPLPTPGADQSLWE